VKSGGTMRFSTTSSILWGTGAALALNSGSFLNISVSSFTLPSSLTDNGATWKYSYSDQMVLNRTYTNIEFSSGNSNGVTTAATKTITAGFTVTGTLTLLDYAVLTAGTITYGASGTLQYGASGESVGRTSIGSEWPTTSGPQNVKIYNSSGVTLSAARAIPGTLYLTIGTLTNGNNLTMAANATISRARGALSQSPTFAGIINLAYTSGVEKVTSSYEVPSTNSVNNLTISSSVGMKLGASLDVAGTLTFAGSSNSTFAELGDYNLTANALSMTGMGFVKTNGAGAFKLKNISASTLIPVGNASYNPVTITNNSGSADDFSVRVIDEVYNSGNSNGSLMPGPHVKKTWLINKTNANGGTGLGFVFNWDPADVTGTITSAALYDYNASAWGKLTGTTSSTSTSLTYTGYLGSSTSFAIGDNSVTLPVTLSAFSASPNGKNNILNWATVSELNSKGFEVQRSTDGGNFYSLGFVSTKGLNGNSISILNYEYVDYDVIGVDQYYRLKQIDIDGASKLSAVVKVSRAIPLKYTVSNLYPNPAADIVYFNFSSKDKTALNVEVLDLSGRVVMKKILTAVAGNNGFDFDVNRLSKGLYVLRVSNSEFISINKFVRK
jgi:hypothetical protein